VVCVRLSRHVLRSLRQSQLCLSAQSSVVVHLRVLYDRSVLIISFLKKTISNFLLHCYTIIFIPCVIQHVEKEKNCKNRTPTRRNIGRLG
jgi:hypothetical protein